MNNFFKEGRKQCWQERELIRGWEGRGLTQGKEKPFSSESNIHFFQDVMIDAAVKTSMSEKVDSSADSSSCIIQYDNNCDT